MEGKNPSVVENPDNKFLVGGTTQSFRFRLDKKNKNLDGSQQLKEGNKKTSCILKPTNVNKEDGARLKCFDKERHFACVRKRDGSYECQELNREEYHFQ